ncbi:MAG: nucleotidyltransferase family protein [Alphaproteobacteria bacterium]|nr:nucleotidyltransferase family protein [Alphaproteobacteria bacterium]
MKKIKEAIILAGGLGTRLQAVVKEQPKCLASIAQQPFLSYQINYLLKQGIERFIFALGYKKEQVINFIHENYAHLDVEFSEELTPLGTGGAIIKALQLTKNTDVLILNGDSYFNINLTNFYHLYQLKEAKLALALKPLCNFERYGRVEINSNNKITNFYEKNPCAKGLINGGIYILNKFYIKQFSFQTIFSIEKDFFEMQYMNISIYGFCFDDYFIDIGIPDDYFKFENDILNKTI